MLWDVRSGKACLRTLDQHNGKPTSSTQQGMYVEALSSGLCSPAILNAFIIRSAIVAEVIVST